MLCSKCQNDTFKAKVIRRQRLKERPFFIPVTLQCAKCSHNIRVWIAKEDLKALKDSIIEEYKIGIEQIMIDIGEFMKAKTFKEKKSLLDRIRGRR